MKPASLSWLGVAAWAVVGGLLVFGRDFVCPVGMEGVVIAADFLRAVARDTCGSVVEQEALAALAEVERDAALCWRCRW